MSDETKAPETTDDRYVAICQHIRVVGGELRETIFKTIEEGDFEQAAEQLDYLAKLDRIYMLSLKTGMEIVENARKAAAPATPAEETAPKA